MESPGVQSRMKVVVSEFMDGPAVEALRANFTVVYDPTLVDQRDALLRAIEDASALIVRNRTKVDIPVLDSGRRLRVIGRLGVGLDNIDVATCKAREIGVISATGANALAVAEYVITAGMMLLRGAYLSTPQVAAGRWPRAALSDGRETAGCILGLVGFGGIGQLTAKLGKSLGMRVAAYDPMMPSDTVAQAGVTSQDLDALLAESDVVSLHVPLTSQTRGLMSAARIAQMKPGAVLVNTARGGIVDETALAEALVAGKLGGAALDVFETEPLPAASPLAAAPNLILTPHIAGVTRESNTRVSTMIATKVAAFLLNA
jgi:(S)-sulfolactate dehydrogenase